MIFLSKWIFFKLLGWKLIGSFPPLDKYIIIVAPHTSWHDFYIGALVRSIVKIKINYVAKKELFDSPFGWYFRWMGGAPIDRSKNSNTVDAIVSIFEERKEFRLAIAPEGTREKVDTWKTGFYYIAKGAGVPIVMAALDYKNKEVRVEPPFYPSDDMKSDFDFMYSNYAGVVGKIPENSFTH
ncbi:1-acyl-sn-glycerol-3-phosphate acyltransferase [Galbibacter sp. EGI 63066]|uniref:1-acyl-sn-glycerol-3-phosphate acyltransferase n=1 Tax=Galbibacter sp. EGI 63066 TaxID=2993559 RepID=UPI0022491E3A|nr:1-acyl-sn-glycerol-3-phosphate acyltransferase [Galbibacter sp. EGI 63066]MCX2680883.1 1-acyl-sn-glycerol-3-phosphate acyltransferase [Galbibacter sp. EGI 63066]